jgi:drug/metabolite transporter (DMT)-like permease/ribosomal protein S18 acetylase RimI-like enzyme
MHKKPLLLALLVLGTAFWGLSYSVVKAGMSYADPFSFLVYKFVGAALAVALLFPRQVARLTWRATGWGILLALPLFAGSALQTIGLQTTSAANAAFLTGLSVLLVPLGKALLYRQSVAPQMWTAGALALLGLYVVAVGGSGWHLHPGDGWVIACAFGFAAYILLVGRAAHEPYPMALLVVQLLSCGVLARLTGWASSQALAVPTAGVFWQAIGFTALLATAYMYGVQHYAQQYISEEKVALTHLCEPIFAALSGALLLHEAITLRTTLGGMLIFCAMVLSELPPGIWRRRQRHGSQVGTVQPATKSAVACQPQRPRILSLTLSHLPMSTPFVRVERATAADIPALLPLMERLADFEHYRDLFAVTAEILYEQGFAQQPPAFYCLVARPADGQLGGMLVYYFIPFTASARPTLFIKELFVDEAYRGQQLGEELMRAAAQAAVAHGCGAVRWAVAAWNEGGRRFYERLGAQANPVWIDYSLSGDALQALAHPQLAD